MGKVLSSQFSVVSKTGVNTKVTKHTMEKAKAKKQTKNKN